MKLIFIIKRLFGLNPRKFKSPHLRVFRQNNKNFKVLMKNDSGLFNLKLIWFELVGISYVHFREKEKAEYQHWFRRLPDSWLAKRNNPTFFDSPFNPPNIPQCVEIEKLFDC